MGSRLRVNPSKLFEVFAEVAKPQQDGAEPFILQKYPPDFDEQDVLNNIPKFAFPCQNNTTQVDQFAFVLTDLESMYRFGYCRHGAGAQTCLCIVSHLPWFEVFYKMLNFVADILNRSENSDILPFIKAAYDHTIPVPDEPVTIVAGQDMMNFTGPDPKALPGIPSSRNLTEYYNALDTNNMVKIFASMLHERRILITSKKLSRVTACIHASEALLYPMHWQHLFIPALPAHLLEYVNAPMPYLIGVHTSLMEVIRNRMEIGDAVIVDADKNEVTSEYDDLDALPEDVASYLKRHLKTQRMQNSISESGDALSRAFMQALVRLIGGYRDALRIRLNEAITFDRDAFVQTRSSQAMQFLESMLQLQIFQQFIDGRLELLNSGEGLDDLFEQEAASYTGGHNTQSKYREWLSKQKRKIKAGGKDIISDMREKAGPMVNTAVNTVKMQSKKLQSRMREMNDNKMSSSKVRGGVVHSRSAGSFDRQRPSTVLGSHPQSTRPPRPPPPHVNSLRPKTGHYDRTKVYTTLTVDDDRGVQDDSQLRLSYHRVDVGLMSDRDIQNIMRSASADPLPRVGEDVTQSASDGDISSTPSSEALSPSDENLVHIPYMDMTTPAHQHTTTAPSNATSSSDEDLAPQHHPPPPVPSRDSKPPHLTSSSVQQGSPAPRDRLIASDRLIGSPRQSVSPRPTVPPRPLRRAAQSLSGVEGQPSSSPKQLQGPPPVATPRRVSLEKKWASDKETPPPLPSKASHSLPQPQQQQQDNPLIRFESSESDTDGVEQFDPLMTRKTPSAAATGSAATAGQPGSDISPKGGSQALIRNKGTRSSLTRAEAFRRTATDIPLRHGYRDDVSPDKETDSKDALADLFDPLAGATTAAAAPPPSSVSSSVNHVSSKGAVSSGNGSGGGSGSGSLMHDWTIGHLSGGAGRGTGSDVAYSPRIPSGGIMTCPVSTMGIQQQHPSSAMLAATGTATPMCLPSATSPRRPHTSYNVASTPFTLQDALSQASPRHHPSVHTPSLTPPARPPPPQKADALASLISLDDLTSSPSKVAPSQGEPASKVGSGMAAPSMGVSAVSSDSSGQLASTASGFQPVPKAKKASWETFD